MDEYMAYIVRKRSLIYHPCTDRFIELPLMLFFLNTALDITRNYGHACVLRA